jgi:hypothetical protein
LRVLRKTCRNIWFPIVSMISSFIHKAYMILNHPSKLALKIWLAKPNIRQTMAQEHDDSSHNQSKDIWPTMFTHSPSPHKPSPKLIILQWTHNIRFITSYVSLHTHIYTWILTWKDEHERNQSVKEGSLFVLFVLMRSIELGCFKLCSWYRWKALKERRVAWAEPSPFWISLLIWCSCYNIFFTCPLNSVQHITKINK